MRGKSWKNLMKWKFKYIYKKKSIISIEWGAILEKFNEIKTQIERSYKLWKSI